MTVFDNGKVVYTGRRPDQVTNLATGKSVVLKLQGRVTVVPQPDGSAKSRMSGTTAFTFFPGDVGPGDIATGRTHLFTGNARLVFAANGSVSSAHDALLILGGSVGQSASTRERFGE